MKIVVLTGSPRQKHSYAVINKIEEQMKAEYNADFEYINITKCNVSECIGCMQCFNKGDDHCPLKDDTQSIRQKLCSADGIIFASPVYALGITATLKKLVDRLSFMFHRPELVSIPAITIVTTSGGGQKPTQDYLKMTAIGWGCNVVGSISVISPFYFTKEKHYKPNYENTINKKISITAKKFGTSVSAKPKPVPSFYDIYMFNGLKSKTWTSKADYDYWQMQDWLDSDYYYDVIIGPIKWIFGRLLSNIIKIAAKNAYSDS